MVVPVIYYNDVFYSDIITCILTIYLVSRRSVIPEGELYYRDMLYNYIAMARYIVTLYDRLIM